MRFNTFRISVLSFFIFTPTQSFVICPCAIIIFTSCCKNDDVWNTPPVARQATNESYDTVNITSLYIIHYTVLNEKISAISSWNGVPGILLQQWSLFQQRHEIPIVILRSRFEVITRNSPYEASLTLSVALMIVPARTDLRNIRCYTSFFVVCFANDLQKTITEFGLRSFYWRPNVDSNEAIFLSNQYNYWSSSLYYFALEKIEDTFMLLQPFTFNFALLTTYI